MKEDQITFPALALRAITAQTSIYLLVGLLVFSLFHSFRLKPFIYLTDLPA